MIRSAARGTLAAALAGAPLTLTLVPDGILPSGLAFLAHEGRAAIAFAVCLALSAYVASTQAVTSLARRLFAPRFEALVSRLAHADRRLAGLATVCTGFLAAAAAMPAWRWTDGGFGGDEPKYLRMAESLLRDLDVDMASQTQGEWRADRFARNTRRLFRDAGDEAARVFSAATVPERHRWAVGNWSLQGLHGGLYYVQSPGLPGLLLPGLIAREVLTPARSETFLPLITLAVLWSFALTQTVQLASEVSGSRPAGLVAGAAAALCAPLLVGGFHFYPESAAAALVPWLARYGRTVGPAPNAVMAAALGLGCGLLPWLHPKFLLMAAVLLGLLVWKLRGARLAATLTLGGALLGLLTLLLFDHHVTGLLTPDALYRRYGSSVYRGLFAFASPLVLNGLVTALFGARDGLLVMAPLLLGGVLAAVMCWRNDRRSTLELAAVFASLWVAAAVHEGGAPGPPGRLMAPVACVLAAFLAVGLAKLRRKLGYVLTVSVLAALTLAITGGMLTDWRRTVNPYREMFVTPERDFAKDLSDGPGRHDAPYETHKSRDRLRGLVLLAILAGWAAWFARHPDDGGQPIEWRLARWALGLWSTVAVAAFALSALGP